MIKLKLFLLLKTKFLNLFLSNCLLGVKVESKFIIFSVARDVANLNPETTYLVFRFDLNHIFQKLVEIFFEKKKVIIEQKILPKSNKILYLLVPIIIIILFNIILKNIILNNNNNNK
jgi:hypothetical protein